MCRFQIHNIGRFQIVRRIWTHHHGRASLSLASCSGNSQKQLDKGHCRLYLSIKVDFTNFQIIEISRLQQVISIRNYHRCLMRNCVNWVDVNLESWQIHTIKSLFALIFNGLSHGPDLHAPQMKNMHTGLILARFFRVVSCKKLKFYCSNWHIWVWIELQAFCLWWKSCIDKNQIWADLSEKFNANSIIIFLFHFLIFCLGLGASRVLWIKKLHATKISFFEKSFRIA